MTGRGANLERVGPFNRAVVLDAVRRNRGISRVELAARTGLAPQTVTKICAELLGQGLVVEAGRVVAGRGKPRTALRLAADGPLAVGIHLDPVLLTVALVDLAGSVVAHDAVVLAPDAAPSAVLGLAAGTARDVVARAGVAPGRLLGAGLAVPGPIDLDRGLVVAPPNLPGWRDVAARDELSRAVGLPVLLDKDVTSAAVAELWSGGVRPGETAAVVHLGTGIGVGLVANGAVVRGGSGNAGEVGHLVVADDGPVCRCGRRGCVAVTASPSAMVTAAHAAGVLGGPDGASPAAVHAVFAAADAGDEVADQIVRGAVTALARLLLDLAALLDLDAVVLGGPYWAWFHRHLLRLAARAGEPALLPGRVRVAGTALGDHAGAAGAASLVLDAAVSPDPRRLVAAGDGGVQRQHGPEAAR